VSKTFALIDIYDKSLGIQLLALFHAVSKLFVAINVISYET